MRTKSLQLCMLYESLYAVNLWIPWLLPNGKCLNLHSISQSVVTWSSLGRSREGGFSGEQPSRFKICRLRGWGASPEKEKDKQLTKRTEKAWKSYGDSLGVLGVIILECSRYALVWVVQQEGTLQFAYDCLTVCWASTVEAEIIRIVEIIEILSFGYKWFGSIW